MTDQSPWCEGCGEPRYKCYCDEDCPYCGKKLITCIGESESGFCDQDTRPYVLALKEIFLSSLTDEEKLEAIRALSSNNQA